MGNIIIKKSLIHGKGVFADRRFEKGETVIDWSTCSTTLTKADVQRLPKAQQRYVSYLGRGKWIKFRSPGKYVNHSCEANTTAIKGRDVANRNILRGEEITADYVVEKTPVSNLKCLCGTIKCIKIINPR